MGNRHLLHVKSNVVDANGTAKLPTSGDIEYGEIAINYAKDHETLSLRNSENEIVPLNINKVNQIVESGLTNVNINTLSGTVENHIAYVSISGNVINVASGDSYNEVEYPTPFNEKVTNVKSNDTISSAFTSVETTISALTQEVLENEIVASKAVNALGTAAGTVNEEGEITYSVNEDAKYIKDAISLADADDILDEAIKDLDTEVKSIKNSYISGGTIGSSASGYTASVENGVLKLTIPESAATHIYKSGTAISISADDTVSFSGDVTIYTDNKLYLVDAKNGNRLGSGVTIPESGKVDNIEVNGVTGTIENKVSKLTIHGHDVKVNTGFTATTYPTAFTSNYDTYTVATADTINQALNKVEKTISALTQALLDDEDTWATGIQNTCNAVGGIVNPSTNKIEYVPDANLKYINTATSLYSADGILDQEIFTLSQKVDKIIEILKNNGFDFQNI